MSSPSYWSDGSLEWHSDGSSRTSASSGWIAEDAESEEDSSSSFDFGAGELLDVGIFEDNMFDGVGHSLIDRDDESAYFFSSSDDSDSEATSSTSSTSDRAAQTIGPPGPRHGPHHQLPPSPAPSRARRAEPRPTSRGGAGGWHGAGGAAGPPLELPALPGDRIASLVAKAGTHKLEWEEYEELLVDDDFGFTTRPDQLDQHGGLRRRAIFRELSGKQAGSSRKKGSRQSLKDQWKNSGGTSRRRDCHSAVPPFTFSRCSNRHGERASSK